MLLAPNGPNAWGPLGYLSHEDYLIQPWKRLGAVPKQCDQVIAMIKRLQSCTSEGATAGAWLRKQIIEHRSYPFNDFHIPLFSTKAMPAEKHPAISKKWVALKVVALVALFLSLST